PRLTFSDVSSVKGSAGYTPYATAIEWLAAQGATFGWGLADRSATFDAHEPATRADLAAFLFRAAGPPVHVPPEESPYEDVSPTDDAYAEITWLAARGVVLAGPAQAFDPAANVSIADAAVAIRRLADEPRVILVQGLTFTPQKEPTALQDALAWLDDRHLLGTTAPSAREARDTALSRGALAQLLYEVHEAGVGLSTTPTLAERWAERTDLAGTLEGMRNGLLPATALCPLPWDVTEALACPAAAGLETLNAAFRAQFGQDIPVADAYRSLAGQRAARADRGWLAAQPGTSMHGWGAAIDLSPSRLDGGFGGDEYAWIIAHAPAHGWALPAWAGPHGTKPEPWHLEYQG
ncbi:MAG: M15 family metallopeptidase, partial [Demequina sp.]|uniref:M15 family metallopeptidase n=1 Tax=Demequina sp. TaxID=2050685 RepID=UPI003A8711E3